MKYTTALEVLTADHGYSLGAARNLLFKANLEGRVVVGDLTITNTVREGYVIKDAGSSVFAPLTQDEKHTLHDVLISACKKSARLTEYNADYDIYDTGNSAVWWEAFNLCRELVP